MKYKVWYVKYTCVEVKADNEDEAIELANDKLDAECDRKNEWADEYELSDIETIK